MLSTNNKFKKTLYRIESKFGNNFQRFANHHPFWASFSIIVGMPIGILAGVMLMTFAIMLPVSYFVGWI